MAERIVTDSRGQRWDVRQTSGSDDAIFRHQSGHELRATLPGALDQLTSDDLLAVLDEARQQEGSGEVGRHGIDVALDADGYETGR
jgi:hypothetical protein